ncbi:MAG TPA: D-amino-acid transaminase [Methylovirgula sp.]
MGPIAYVNGLYLPQNQAMVHIEDRGYQFSDGVYEVCEINAGALIDEARHLARLKRSLAELQIAMPLTEAALPVVLRQVMRRNRVRDGYIYLQVTRGVAPREHYFPAPAVRPSLVVTARAIDPAKGAAAAAKGIAVISQPDIRWGRPDIKTIGLLPNVLARQAAKEQGAQEAWLIDADGMVTEGAATNAWIVDHDNVIVTRQIDNGILSGVTRGTLLNLIRQEGLQIQERRFSLAEAKAAREAFVTGATSLVMPVISVDGQPIGDGRPGPLAQRLRVLFHKSAERSV